MKFFTIGLDSVTIGAIFDNRFDGIAPSPELMASGDFFQVPTVPGREAQRGILKASVEVWNLSRFFVPERTPGSALLVLDFPVESTSAAVTLGPQLIRLGTGESCRFEHVEEDTNFAFGRVFVPRRTTFEAQFTGAFLKVYRDNKLMTPDEVIV